MFAFLLSVAICIEDVLYFMERFERPRLSLTGSKAKMPCPSIGDCLISSLGFSSNITKESSYEDAVSPISPTDARHHPGRVP